MKGMPGMKWDGEGSPPAELIDSLTQKQIEAENNLKSIYSQLGQSPVKSPAPVKPPVVIMPGENKPPGEAATKGGVSVVMPGKDRGDLGIGMPEDKADGGGNVGLPPIKKVEENVDEDGNPLSGIKKALVSDKIIEGVDLEKISDKEMMALGRKIIDTGEVKPEALVQKIITEKTGVLTPKEVVALVTYKADVDNDLREAYKQANDKLDAGEDMGTLWVEIADLERQQNDFDVMAVITANQQSMAFRLRKMMLDRDYNVVMQIERYKKNNNGSIPAEVEAKFRDLDKKLKELKEKIAEVEKRESDKEGQEAVDNIKESVDREKTYTEEELDKKIQQGVESEIAKLYEELPTEKRGLADKAITALEKFRAKLKGGGRTYEATLGIPIAIADLGAATAIRAIKVGKSVAEAVRIGINRIKDALKERGITTWEKEAEYAKDLIDFLEAEGVSTKKQPKTKPTITEDGTVSIPNEMLRDLVKRGITDINDLTDEVHKEVVKDLPDITTRQVRDYITDYGKKVNPTADEVQTQINTAKRIGRLLSELEDLQKMDKVQFAAKYLKPKPSGSKITERERELKQKIKSLGGEFMGDVAKETKEARTNSQRLEDAKKKVNDSIAKIREEIITKERELKEKQKPLNEDLELARLKESEAALKNLRDKYLPEPKDAFENEKARERVKDRLVDEIIDLNEQINAGEKKAKDITPKFADDAQLNKLREIKKAKQGVLDIIDPRAKEEVRIKSAIKAAGRSLAEYQRRLAEKDTSPKAKEDKPTTPELDAIRKQRDDARKEYEEFKKTVPKTEAQILSESKQRANTRIKQLETKIKNKDFAKPVKKTPVTDTELQSLNHKKELLQEEFDKEQYKVTLQNRKWWQKAEDIGLELFTGISRALVAGFDLSAGLVQGTWRWFTDPKLSAEATAEMFKQFASEKRNAEWFTKLKASGAYEKIKQSKLAVTDEHGRASVKEGLFITNLANRIYDAVAYLITVGYKPATKFVRQINPLRASQRAFDGYVNYIRVAKFLELTKTAEGDGYTFEADPKIYEKLADHVNTTTGRGSLGALETSSKWLSILMFAPRKVVSEVKLFTPYAFLYYAKMPKYVRQKALLSFSKFIVSYVSVNAAIWAAKNVLGGGDDDDDDHFWDMTSSDFMTHKFGNTRINVGGGAKSALVFMARLFTGKFTDQYGKTTHLGDRFGKQINTRFDLVLGYLKGKASPGAGAVIKKLDERKGLEVDDAEMVKDLVVPMWLQDSKELYKDHSVAIGTLFNVLSIFGANVRTVDPSKQPQSNTVTIKDPQTFLERHITTEEDKQRTTDIDTQYPEVLDKYNSGDSKIFVDKNDKIHLSKKGGDATTAEKNTWEVISPEDLTEKQKNELKKKVKDKVADEVTAKIKY